MRFLIDCDDVIAKWTQMFVQVCKDEFNILISSNESADWDIFKHPKIIENKDKIWSYILSTKNLIYNLEKYDYTDELLKKLRERGEVICVTSIVANTAFFGNKNEKVIPGYYSDERIMWLINKAGFSRKDIILAHNKYLIEGNVLIDDKPDNVIQWANNWHKEGYRQSVFWQSIDKSISINDSRIFKCNNVDDLIKFVDSMKIYGK